MFKRISLSRLILILAFIAACFGFANYMQKVQAASINVGVLKIDYPGVPGPLFKATNIAPGYSEAKSLAVNNTGNYPHSFSIAVHGDLGELANVLVIEPYVSGVKVWTKSISEIAKDPESNVIIGSIVPGASVNADLIASLPQDTNNTFQNKTTLAFSFVVGNENTDQIENGNYQLSSLPTISFVGETSRDGNRTIVRKNPLTAEANDDVSLMPESASNQKEETGSEEEATKGTVTEAKSLCFWWIVILIILIISLVLYHRYIKEEKPVFWWLWPFAIALILFFVQVYFDSKYIPTVFCDLFWVLELVTLAGFFSLNFWLERKESE